MSEVAAQKAREAGDAPVTTAGADDSAGAMGSQSPAEQAKEKLHEGAEAVQEKGVELREQAGERVRLELDSRSTQAGKDLQGTGEALRRAGEQLRQEGKETPAKVTAYLADRADRLGGYLSSASSDQLLRDVEGFARRQPWLMAAAGATAGFLASRFLKASGSRGAQGGPSASTQFARQPASPSPEVSRTTGGGGDIASPMTHERDADTVVVAGGGSSGRS